MATRTTKSDYGFLLSDPYLLARFRAVLEEFGNRTSRTRFRSASEAVAKLSRRWEPSARLQVERAKFARLWIGGSEMDFLMRKQLFGLAACALIVFGVFAPAVSLPVIGEMSYLRVGKSDCTILLFLVAASGALLLFKRFQGLWLTGTASIAMILFTLVDLTAYIEEARISLERNMQASPLSGLGALASRSIQLQWGWGVLFVGALSTLLVAAWEDTEEARRLARRKLLVVSGLIAICWLVFYFTANLNNPAPSWVQGAMQP